MSSSGAGLERMVRPFQTQNFTQPQRVLTDYQSDASSANVMLEFGRNGTGKMLNLSYSNSVTLYMDTKLKETSQGSAPNPITL